MITQFGLTSWTLLRARRLKLRGQACVVLDDVNAARSALRQMQGCPCHFELLHGGISCPTELGKFRTVKHHQSLRAPYSKRDNQDDNPSGLIFSGGFKQGHRSWPDKEQTKVYEGLDRRQFSRARCMTSGYDITEDGHGLDMESAVCQKSFQKKSSKLEVIKKIEQNYEEARLTLATTMPTESTTSPVGAWPLYGPSMSPQCRYFMTTTGGGEYTAWTSHAKPPGNTVRNISCDDSNVSFEDWYIKLLVARRAL